MWSGRRRWPLVSIAGGVLAAGLVLLPLVFLIDEALQPGWGEIERLLLRHNTAVLLWNTLRLVVASTALCAVIGVAAAWCVERTTIPARRVWAVLLVLPLGVPDFVIGFGWVSLDHSLHGYQAAVMIMTLSLYPLVYLPAVAGLAGVDPALEEVARSLGLGPWMVFWKVTLRQMLPAVLGGCLLVTLGLLAEYGAFEIVQYQTFTVAIFTEFKLGFDTAAACALSLVLVALGVAALAGELPLVRRGRWTSSGQGARRAVVRVRLGRRWTIPALCSLFALSGLALGVPLGSLVYWLIHGGSTHAAAGVDPHRRGSHSGVQRRRRGAGDGAGDPGERRGDAPSQQAHDPDRAPRPLAPGAPRAGRGAGARVVHGALRAAAV